ncbi:radical SAM protein [bacterium]|nr:radical SAM protein [bacterium]MBU1752476.1 radical SAM protein [bacterium]
MHGKKIKHGLAHAYFLYHYIRGSRILNYMPMNLMIEPTNMCNLKCRMCPQDGLITRQKGMMDMDLYKKIIDEAKSFVWCLQLFHTGESLLHPKLPEMIEYAQKAGMYTVLNTNTTLLTKEKALEILSAGLSQISFSFDGPTPEIYEKTRVGASFEQVMNNIKTFIALKKQQGIKQPCTIIEVIPMKETQSHLPDFLKELKSFGADDVRCWGYHEWTHNKLINNRYYPCEYPYTIMAVYWDGRVGPCCMDYDGKYIIGDVREQSLSQIWNSSEIQGLRAALQDKNSQVELCKNCSFLASPKTYVSLSGKAFKVLSGMVGKWRYMQSDK